MQHHQVAAGQGASESRLVGDRLTHGAVTGDEEQSVCVGGTFFDGADVVGRLHQEQVGCPFCLRVVPIGDRDRQAG